MLESGPAVMPGARGIQSRINRGCGMNRVDQGAVRRECPSCGCHRVPGKEEGGAKSQGGRGRLGRGASTEMTREQAA